MITIEKMTMELHKAFKLLNEKYFENKLPIPAITIQSSSHKKLSMGWCSVKEIWGNKEGSNKMYELNISAEYMDINFFETMDTLMHEMVHLYNNIHQIQDCSRNNTYHNKKFKDQAIQSGFIYETNKPHKQYGWSFAKLSEETKYEIAELNIDQNVFTMARKNNFYFESIENGGDPEEIETQAKKKSFKWTCPDCDVIVRSTKLDILLICGRCKVKLETEDI